METFLGLLLGWFMTALFLTFFRPPPEASPAVRLSIVLGPIAALSLSALLLPRFRRLLGGIPLRWMIALHVVRLPVGIVFFLLSARGLLPAEFSLHAGVGDILAGGLALGLLLIFRRAPIPVPLLVSWNVIGLLDFMNVQRVVTQLAAAGRGGEFIAMQGPPLALVPYFGVPLLFFTHLYMLSSLKCSGGDHAQA